MVKRGDRPGKGGREGRNLRHKNQEKDRGSRSKKKPKSKLVEKVVDASRVRVRGEREKSYPEKQAPGGGATKANVNRVFQKGPATPEIKEGAARRKDSRKGIERNAFVKMGGWGKKGQKAARPLALRNSYVYVAGNRER